MPDTPNYALPFPSLSDVPNAPADMEALAEAVDAQLLQAAAGTGLRDLSASLINGWTTAGANGVTIVRIGNSVQVNVYGLNGTAATNNVAWAPGDGFRLASAQVSVALFQGTTPVNTSMSFAGTGLLTTDRGSALRASLVYYTADAWPTVLPGAPVNAILA